MGVLANWATPTAWYSAATANYYAQFWHKHSVGGLAYGFAYDDVSNQRLNNNNWNPGAYGLRYRMAML